MKILDHKCFCNNAIVFILEDSLRNIHFIVLDQFQQLETLKEEISRIQELEEHK